MSDTDLNALDSLPAAYYRGRDERRKGITFERHIGESREDAEYRYCGFFDAECGISPAERVEAEKNGENV